MPTETSQNKKSHAARKATQYSPITLFKRSFGKGRREAMPFARHCGRGERFSAKKRVPLSRGLFRNNPTMECRSKREKLESCNRKIHHPLHRRRHCKIINPAAWRTIQSNLPKSPFQEVFWKEVGVGEGRTLYCQEKVLPSPRSILLSYPQNRRRARRRGSSLSPDALDAASPFPPSPSRPRRKISPISNSSSKLKVPDRMEDAPLKSA